MFLILAIVLLMVWGMGSLAFSCGGRDARGRAGHFLYWGSGRQKHQAEVDKVGGLIEEIDALRPEDEKWMAKVKAVHTSLETHIREEEGEIFPRISKVWDEARLEQAGKQMKEMKSKKAHAA